MTDKQQQSLMEAFNGEHGAGRDLQYYTTAQASSTVQGMGSLLRLNRGEDIHFPPQVQYSPPIPRNRTCSYCRGVSEGDVKQCPGCGARAWM